MQLLEGMSLNSLIIPIYKNESSLGKVIEVCAWIHQRLNQSLEVVFVVDGSPDESIKILKKHTESVCFQYQIVELSRNFGSFAAIKKGLELARGENFAVMAADLQEPQELILEFFGELQAGDSDVVLGSRESRKDPLISRLFSEVFWLVYRKMIQPEMPKGGVDIFGCNKIFRNYLIQLNESHSSLVGLIFWMGFKRKIIPYCRKERGHGKSAWTVRKKIRYMLDSIFSFTDLPIQFLMAFGFLGSGVSFLLGVLIVVSKMTGAISVPGYAATALIILFFASLNSLGLGIIGIYVWRAFENTKQRPLSLVSRNFNDGLTFAGMEVFKNDKTIYTSNSISR